MMSGRSIGVTRAMLEEEENMYRQGDVLIIPTKAIPSTARAQKRDQGLVILALGEVTGHHHAIGDQAATLWIDQLEHDVRKMFLKVAGTEPVALVHQEHGTITIPPGNYIVRRQREYFPKEIRLVAD